MLLPLIILVILGCIYAGSLTNPKTRLYVVVTILILILSLCYIQINGGLNLDMFSNKNENFASMGYASLDYVMRNGNGSNSSNGQGCDGFNYANINNQIGTLGTYDGLVLPNKFVTKPLLASPVIFTPTGDGIVLTEDPASKNFPTVNGKKGSPKHLFSLANNMVSWDCCGSSPFSSGQNGCVCLSDEQMAMFGHRGYNKTKPVEYPEM